MFILGNFFEAVAVVLDYALSIFMWIIIARAVLSWVNPDPYNNIVRFINNITDPVLYQIRKKLPVNFGGLDISPIIAMLGIIFVQTFVVGSLHRLAMTLSWVLPLQPLRADIHFMGKQGSKELPPMGPPVFKKTENEQTRHFNMGQSISMELFLLKRIDLWKRCPKQIIR